VCSSQHAFTLSPTSIEAALLVVRWCLLLQMRKRMQSRSLLCSASTDLHTIQPHPLNMLICEAGLAGSLPIFVYTEGSDYVRVVQFWLLVGGRQPRICIN
jgi:hypothetical protein